MILSPSLLMIFTGDVLVVVVFSLVKINAVRVVDVVVVVVAVVML